MSIDVKVHIANCTQGDVLSDFLEMKRKAKVWEEGFKLRIQRGEVGSGVGWRPLKCSLGGFGQQLPGLYRNRQQQLVKGTP